MPAINIRNVDQETHQRLRERAATHGRSMQAECRDILRQAVETPADGRSIVELFRAAFGPQHGLSAAEAAAIGDRRRTPPGFEPIDFTAPEYGRYDDEPSSGSA